MRLPVNAPFRIHVSPIFPWEKRTRNLVVRTPRGFHPRHVTSRLCVEMLAKHRTRLEGGTFLDVGCASGILALAAARLGARWAVGVDVHGPSVGGAARNALENGLETQTAWVVGSVDCVRGSFSFVAANVPWHVWLEIGKETMQRVAVGGLLLVSGFQDLHLAPVMDQLKEAGFVVLERTRGDESFFGIPPSGSYTWMAVLALRTDPEAGSRP
ncbi:MAG: ribosomal protein methyltransferase [Desulfacinum sp.]|jgi:ribosomal protein L11 methyltransferase|nr:ribosomal protein methyltransferase [Desulfacinum sp.]